MDIRRCFMLTLAIGLAITASAVPIDSILLSPKRPVVDFATLAEVKPFENVPVYKLGNGRQIVNPDGWSGKNDFYAEVAILWNESQIAFRIDVLDDVSLPAAPTPTEPRGDYILIHAVGQSATPAQDPAESAFDLLLAPKPADSSCDASVWTSVGSTKTAIGQVQTHLVPKPIGGYVLYVVMDTSAWSTGPATERSLKLQMEFGDFDQPQSLKKPDHQFVLCPSTEPFTKKLAEFGTIRFLEDRWLVVQPVNSLFRVGDSSYSVSYGNFDKHDRSLTIKLLTLDKKPTVAKTIENVLAIPANTAGTNIPVELDLSDLPPGGYQLKAEFGITSDLTDRYVGITSSHVYYDLLTIERRSTTRQRLEGRRQLTAALIAEDVRRTFRYLAGRGDVLWSAGAYDATSDEFVPSMRESGPYTIELPAAKPDAVPWALFAKNEELSHMNRPFVVKLNDSVFAGEGSLRPMLPNWPLYNEAPATRKADSESRRLLLIGLVSTYAGPYQLAKIRVTSGERVVAEQTLNPGPTAQLGGRYAHVLRLWLTDADRELHIENIADFGVFAEIDFMALLGPGDIAKPTPDEAQLIFQGNEAAHHFSRMVDTSSYLMQTCMVDAKGRGYASLPGGKHQGPDPVAGMLLLNELSAWRARSASRLLAGGVVHDATGIIGPPVGYTMAKPMAIMGYYNHWRRSGRIDSVIDPLWGDFIQVPMRDMVADLRTNPQGLVSATGRYGDNTRESGAATYPMVMAVIGSLRAAAVIAEHKREPNLAEEWRAAASELEEHWKAQLFTAQTSLRLDSNETFPASDYLPESRGLSAQIPAESIVYGRFITGSPLIYANGVRVFDTPYVFSGLTTASDLYGFGLEGTLRDKLTNSLRYVMQEGELAARPAFKQYRVFDYLQSDLNTWAIQAAVLADSTKLASEMLQSMTRYTYDEMIDLPVGAMAEVSPWTFEDDFNISETGQNLGAAGDDLNAYNGTAALRLARLIAGVDDADYAELKLTPRLPDGWTRVEAKNWLVCHDFLGGSADLITYSYEAYSDMRYSVKIEPESQLTKVTVRVGPFERTHLNATVVSNGVAKTVPTVLVGSRKYVYLTYENVGNLNISVQPVR